MYNAMSPMDGYDLNIALIPSMVVITNNGCFLSPARPISHAHFTCRITPRSPYPNTQPANVYQ